MAREKNSHSFSIEMASRNSLKNLLVSGESVAFIEGDLGDDLDFEVVEGILLQISGDNGVFRLDLDESELEKILQALRRR